MNDCNMPIKVGKRVPKGLHYIIAVYVNHGGIKCTLRGGSFSKFVPAGWGVPVSRCSVFARPALAEVREFKLASSTRDPQHLPLLLSGLRPDHAQPGDKAKNAEWSIFHIEGDPDHPVNRGTLCPKGAGLVDFIHSPNRLKYPEYRAPAPRSGSAFPGTRRLREWPA